MAVFVNTLSARGRRPYSSWPYPPVAREAVARQYCRPIGPRHCETDGDCRYHGTHVHGPHVHGMPDGTARAVIRPHPREKRACTPRQVAFNWKGEAQPGRREENDDLRLRRKHIGFVAQEVEDVFPELVHGGG